MSPYFHAFSWFSTSKSIDFEAKNVSETMENHVFSKIFIFQNWSSFLTPTRVSRRARLLRRSDLRCIGLLMTGYALVESIVRNKWIFIILEQIRMQRKPSFYHLHDSHLTLGCFPWISGSITSIPIALSKPISIFHFFHRLLDQVVNFNPQKIM